MAHLETSYTRLRPAAEETVVFVSVESVAIAVFVKTPGVSPLKTRLAAGLGSILAEEFHRRASRCVQETLTELTEQLRERDISVSPAWAVAEKTALNHPLWSRFPSLSQGTGGLGARMHFVHNRLLAQHDAVLLLGADSPQIFPQILQHSIAALERHEFVLGPSNDGGFYLLGSTVPIPLALWERVPYSVPETAKCMSEELTTLGGVHHLKPLVDVDVADDLQLVLPELKSFPEGSAQRQLAGWIAELPTASDELTENP